MRNREQDKKPNWLSIVILLLVLAPEITVPLGIIAGTIYILLRALKTYEKNVKLLSQTTHTHKPKAMDDFPKQLPKTTYTRKPEELDDCPKQLFCFHKDKAEHHVSRGKEIDPWDRPDIDIRKYQRKG